VRPLNTVPPLPLGVGAGRGGAGLPRVTGWPNQSSVPVPDPISATESPLRSSRLLPHQVHRHRASLRRLTLTALRRVCKGRVSSPTLRRYRAQLDPSRSCDGQGTGSPKSSAVGHLGPEELKSGSARTRYVGKERIAKIANLGNPLPAPSGGVYESGESGCSPSRLYCASIRYIIVLSSVPEIFRVGWNQTPQTRRLPGNRPETLSLGYLSRLEQLSKGSRGVPGQTERISSDRRRRLSFPESYCRAFEHSPAFRLCSCS